jgi:hypothetical protein
MLSVISEGSVERKIAPGASVGLVAGVLGDMHADMFNGHSSATIFLLRTISSACYRIPVYGL